MEAAYKIERIAFRIISIAINLIRKLVQLAEFLNLLSLNPELYFVKQKETDNYINESRSLELMIKLIATWNISST